MTSVEDRLKAAAQHKTSGDRGSATALLESVLDVTPGHCGALSALAEIRLEEGDADQAMQLLNEALSRDRTHCDARNLLTTLLLARNKRNDARELVDETLELSPLNSRACALRADIHVADNEFEQAELLLRNALSERPDDATLLSALASLFSAARQNRAALHLAQEALARDPGNARHLARLGCVLAELGDHQKAATHLAAAHLKLPTDPVIMLFLAESQAATGQTREARALAKRLTLRYPGLLAGWLLLIRVEALRGDTRKVFSDFLQQVKKHPDKPAALVSLAMAYRSLGYLSKPIRLLQPFLEDNANANSQHRPQALTVLRDCMLASDSLENLAATIPDAALPRWPFGEEAQEREEGAEAPGKSFTETDLLIDPTLSSLDALVLLRFASGSSSVSPRRRIFGAAHLAPVAELVDAGSFVAFDSPRGRQVLAEADDPVPLTAIVGLPHEQLMKRRQSGPYVRPDETRRRKWRDALHEFPRPIVALAWDGGPPGLMLEDYRPMLNACADFDGTFVSVMWDKARHQLSSWPDIIDAGKHFADLSDLSALLAEVDLLIGPDGLPVHVAGAMGRPAAVLTRPAHPWYWHANRGRATWYPSVQVFRSKRFGHWSSLMEDLSDPLQDLISGLPMEERILASG
jgi:tetratricopeptide (TPR) repeat protein